MSYEREDHREPDAPPIDGQMNIFGGTPRARVTDPDTSHQAAASVQHVRESQQAVLWCFDRGPLTDQELEDVYAGELRRGSILPAQSPSGLRTRRHELVELGQLEDSGQRRRLTSGRNATVWRKTRDA